MYYYSRFHRLTSANLVTKIDVANLVKKTSFYEKLKTATSNKNELNNLSKLSSRNISKKINKRFEK